MDSEDIFKKDINSPIEKNDFAAKDVDPYAEVVDKFDPKMDRLLSDINEIKAYKKQIEYLGQSYEEQKDKLAAHERNVISTMGLLFSLFIGISSSLSLFSFMNGASLWRGVFIVVGVILVNMTLVLFLTFMIKILFTSHKKEESLLIEKLRSPTQFFWSIALFFLSIIISVLFVALCLFIIKNIEILLTR